MKARRSIILGELYAGSDGMRCEYPNCNKRTFTIYLKPEEKYPTKKGTLDALAALKLGEAMVLGDSRRMHREETGCAGDYRGWQFGPWERVKKKRSKT